MTDIRKDCLPLPAVMRGCRVDHRGYPVPWFVTAKDFEGHWDFRNVEATRFHEARNRQVCWVSGKNLWRYRAFVIGPMCVINRVAADPPVRGDVGIWSAKVCPFLTRPMAHRPADPRDVGGVMQGQRGIALSGNPGVCAVYVTKFYDYDGSGLFSLGDPETVTWFHKGREATASEVDEAITKGFPALLEMAEKQGPLAVEALAKAARRAQEWMPDA